MSLAPGQKAFMAGRLGVMRLGASRLGWYQPWIKVYINGVLISGARVAGFTVTDDLNHEPNTASFRIDGAAPLKGQEVKIYMGDTRASHQLFGGHILSVSAVYELKPTNTAWDVGCIDYTWLLNRRKVIKKYTNQSASAIVSDLIATFSSGFTVFSVEPGLATIDEIVFTNEELADAITRVMERTGGYWEALYTKDIKAFLAATDTAGSITDSNTRGMSEIRASVDLSQMATRVIARGGGSNAAGEVGIGAATLPVEDDSWYAGGGGTVECGPQRLTYTGVQAGGAGSNTGYLAPPGAISLVGGTGGALTAGATYLVAGTYTSAEGETSAGAISQVTLGGGENEILYSNFAVPVDPKVTLKAIYISDPNGAASTLKKYTDVAVATTSGVIAGAGSGAIPTVNAAGFGSIATPAGSTSLPVEDCAPFLSGGGWAAAPGGQVFSYSGRSVSAGPGTLTGIPASGIGSLVASVRAGTVTTTPHLTGVTGIVYAIVKGDPVNVVVTVNDATAQTALAALVGGDGIHEMFISDGRWSITEATARANAELAMRKDPITTVTFKSRDKTIQGGRSITIAVTNPAVNGTFKIQRVTISGAGFAGPRGWVFPLRDVECSSVRFSFEDLLRQIKRNAA